MTKISDNGGLSFVGVTTTQTSNDFTNDKGARGIVVVVDSTVIGTGSVTLSIQGKDKVSGKYYTLLASAAIVTNVTTAYMVFPGATVTANVSANACLPETYRFLVTANNANAATYTVGWSTLA